jgi:hypothetical protein
VALAGWQVDVGVVLVVFVVDVRVVVVERFVAVQVYVSVEEQQGDADCHERAGGEVAECERFGEDEWCEDGAGEGRDGEAGGFACGTEVSERERVEVDAESVADGTERERGRQNGDGGEVLSDAGATVRLTMPAAPVLTRTMDRGSRTVRDWVRLLSRAQPAQAAAMRRMPIQSA